MSIRVLYLLIACIDLISAKNRIISCHPNQKQYHSVDDFNSQCTVSFIRKTPWSTKQESTSPFPKWENIKPYHIFTRADGSKQIALNMQWSQPVVNFNKYVEGYYISVSEIDTIGGIKLQINLRNKSIITEHLDNSEVVTFNYMYYGQSDNINVKFGQRYVLEIHALPMYHPDISPNPPNLTILLPGCDDADINETVECIENREEEYLYEPGSYYDSEGSGIDQIKDHQDFNNAMIICFGIFIVVILILVLIVLYVKRKNLQRKKKKRKTQFTDYHHPIDDNSSILVLVSTSKGKCDDSYNHVANKFASLLSDCGLNVVFNLWKKQDLIDQPFQWTKQQIDRCGVVVFICTPVGKINSRQGNMLPDPFSIAAHHVKRNNYTYRNKTYLVHFGDEKVILDDSKEVCCKVFDLQSGFKDFYKSLKGREIDPDYNNSIAGLTNDIVQLHLIPAQLLPTEVDVLISGTNNLNNNSRHAVQIHQSDNFNDQDPTGRTYLSLEYDSTGDNRNTVVSTDSSTYSTGSYNHTEFEMPTGYYYQENAI